MIRPGLCSVTLRALPPMDVIVLALQAGLHGIEWGGDIHVPPGPAIARQVGRMTVDAGLEVVSYGSYLRPPGDGMDAFAPVLEAAVALGAPNIRVWPGFKDRPSASYSAQERAAAVAQLGMFADAAAKQGVAVSLEYHPGTLTDDAGSAAMLLAEVPQVQTYWQPSPGLPLADALAEIALLGARVSHVHVFAWDTASARFPLADAEPYWAAVFDALPAPTRTRFALLEFVRGDAPDALLEDAAVLRRLLARV